MRITLQQLRLAPLTLHCEEIFVCENPAVLRAAAARLTAAALVRYPDAEAWRMGSEGYRSAAGAGPARLGVPAATPWDPPLCDAMRQAGWAVMEERLLDRLLTDLEMPRSGMNHA